MSDVPKILYILSEGNVKLAELRGTSLGMGGYHYLLGKSGVVVMRDTSHVRLDLLLVDMIRSKQSDKVVVDSALVLGGLHRERITELEKVSNNIEIVRDMGGEEVVTELMKDIQSEIGEGEPMIEGKMC